MNELFDADDIVAAGRQLGVIERRRKLNLPALVEATVLTLTGPDGPQTTIFGNYITLAGGKLARSSFYEWFSTDMAVLMAELSHRAIEAVRAVERDHKVEHPETGLLARLGDVRITDSTSVLLHRWAQPWAPATSKQKRPAGIKIHGITSLDSPVPHAWSVTSQRAHDSPALDEQALAPGTLLIADLGYVDHARELRLIERGVHFLRRLKDTENPTLVRVLRGGADGRDAEGMRLQHALEAGAVKLEQTVELEAEWTAPSMKPRPVRVIAVQGPDQQFHWYVTSLGAAALSADEVPVAYGLRWEIELVWKAFKSGMGLDKIAAWRPSAVAVLVHAKVIAMCLARLLQLTADQRAGKHATTQLCIVLVLARMSSTILMMRLMQHQIPLDEMERRVLNIAEMLGKSRRQRRERRKRKARNARQGGID